MSERARVCVCLLYPPHDANSLSGEEAWVADFIVHNAVKHLLFIIPWERRLRTNTEVTQKHTSLNPLLIFCHLKQNQHLTTVNTSN